MMANPQQTYLLLGYRKLKYQIGFESISRNKAPGCASLPKNEMF